MSHLPTLGGASGPPIPFPAAVISHLDLHMRRQKPVGRGKIVARNELGDVSPIAIVYQGPNLEVICPRNGERLAAWTFKGDDDRKGNVTGGNKHHRDEYDVVGNRSTEITCVTEMAMTVSRHATSSQAATVDEASFISTATSQRHTVRRLVVAGLSSGLVCIIDIKSCRLIRAVRMPYRVTAVAVLSNGSIGSSDEDDGSAAPLVTNRNFAEELLFFQGVIAVGTQEGHLYFLDAALDLPDADESEKNPCDLHFLSSKRKKTSENLASLRASVHQRGERLCIPVNDQAYSGARKIFQYLSNVTGETTYFPEDGVVVSHLQYIPQLGNLLVGFNFGSWQMWNTSRLILEFASSYDGAEPTSAASTSKNGTSLSSLPVTSFAFSEPENDPRNFCYVWVARGENDFDTLDEKFEQLNSKATLSLYALSFKNRDDGGELYGVLYTGLTSCTLRFDHTLLGDPQTSAEHQTTGSTCLACYSLGNSSGSLNAGAGETDLINESDPDSQLSKAGITLFLWEVQFASRQNLTEKASKFYMGLFDLNAWYQAQMPLQVELEPHKQCSFFSFCSLDDVTVGENGVTQQLIDVWIDASTLSRHNQTTTTSLSHAIIDPSQAVTMMRPEQHFYPSSLAFDLICLLDQGFVHASHLGLQRKVLLELQSEGRSGLVDPSDLYQLCCIAGLIVTSGASANEQDFAIDDNSLSSVSEEERGPRVSDPEKRAALLTVALEHNLINLLTGCVFHWSDGKYSEAGCTLRFILDWAWTSISSIKQAVDKSTLRLFDWSGLELSDGNRRSLVQRSQQLHHLCTLIKRSFEVVASNQRWQHMEFQSLDDQLKLKLHLAQLISTYLDVILWFLNAGLLPEQSEDSGTSLFPGRHMSKVYSEKRERMRARLEAWGEADCLGHDDKFKISSGLLIDGLCTDLGDQFKCNLEREGGTGLYPPPTLHALLVSYLIHNNKGDDQNDNINTNANLVHKHRLIQYLFLDLASCLTNSNISDGNTSIVESLIKFPSAFGMPNSVIKLTQAFWLVDHEDFDEAISMLLDPLVCGNDISHWQHRSILMAFLLQDRAKLALKYTQIRQPPHKDITDIQIHISVLLANGMVHESFQFLRRRWSSGLQQDSERDKQILLYYFFNRCDTLGKLDSILQLPLMLAEERILVDFLLNSDERKINRKEILLLYYLQRARYSEAIALNDQLERRNGEGGRTRKAIMDRYANLIPKFKGYDLGTLNSRWPASTATYAQPIAVMMSAAQQGRSSPNPTFQSLNTFKRLGENPISSNEFTPFRPRHRRRKWEESDSTEKNAATAEANPDTLAPNSKRSRLDVDFSSPAPTPKRSAPQSSILSVLTTPLIERRVGSILGRSQHLSMLGLDVSERSNTPHSILKVKGAVSAALAAGGNQSTDSPLSMLFAASRRRTISRTTNDVVDEEETDENWLVKHRTTSSMSRESTPGKSLRFNVPKRLPPPEIVTPEEFSCEASTISPEKTLSYAEKSKQTSFSEKSLSHSEVSDIEKEEKPRARPEDDDSIVLVSDDESEEDVQNAERSVDSVENEHMSTEDLGQEESEVEEIDIESEDQENVESDVESDESDGENVESEVENAESDVQEIYVESSEEGDDHFESFGSPEDVDVRSNRADKSLRSAERTMYGADQTLAVDESMVRQLASHDSNNETADVSVLEKTSHEIVAERSFKEGSNVTLYGQEDTLPLDISYVRQLAKRDLKDAVKCDSTEPVLPATPGWSDRSLHGKMSDRTLYGHDVTASVDLSLIRQMVQKDVEESNKTNANVEMSVDQTAPGDMTFEENNKTVKIDVNLVRKLAQKDRETTPAESEKSQYNATLDTSVKSPERFSFSTPRQLVRKPEPLKTFGRPSSSFKFGTPHKIQADSSTVEVEKSPEINLDLTADSEVSFAPRTPLRAYVSLLEDLGEEDSGEITFKDTPKPVPASPKPGSSAPSSVKKRKRFSESLGSSFQLEAIVEEEHAVPSYVPGGKEERFRTKDASKRLRSTSATVMSPVVKTPSRRRSSQSVSDVPQDSSFIYSEAQKLADAKPADVSVHETRKSTQNLSTTTISRRRTRSSVSETEVDPPRVTTPKKCQVLVESEPSKLSPQKSQEFAKTLTPTKSHQNVQNAAEVEPTKTLTPTKSHQNVQNAAEVEPTKTLTPTKSHQNVQNAAEVEPTKSLSPAQKVDVVSMDEDSTEGSDAFKSFSPKNDSKKEESDKTASLRLEDSNERHFQSLPSTPEVTASNDAPFNKTEVETFPKNASHVEIKSQSEPKPIELLASEESKQPVEFEHIESQSRTRRGKMSTSISHPSPAVTRPRRRTKSSLSESTSIEPVVFELKDQAKKSLESMVELAVTHIEHKVEPVHDQPQVELESKVELAKEPIQEQSDEGVKLETESVQLEEHIAFKNKVKSRVELDTVLEPAQEHFEQVGSVSLLEKEAEPVQHEGTIQILQDQVKIQPEIVTEQDKVEPVQKHSDKVVSTPLVEEVNESIQGEGGKLDLVQDRARVEPESKVELATPMEQEDVESVQEPCDNLELNMPSILEKESVKGDEDDVEPVEDLAKAQLVKVTIEGVKETEVSAVELIKKGKLLSHTLASPFVVEGVVRRRTRSTLSESEPNAQVIGLTPGRKPKKSESEPSASSTPGRRSKKSEEAGKVDLTEVESEIQHAKGTTPARRSRKMEAQSSKDKDEGPAPVSIIKESVTGTSPSRRVKKDETLKKPVPSTPEPKEDVTQVLDTASRRQTRHSTSSVSQPSPSTRTHRKSSTAAENAPEFVSGSEPTTKATTPARRSSRTETLKEEASPLPASPLPRTPGRRGKSALAVVPQLSPIPEKPKRGKISEIVEEKAISPSKSAANTPSRATRRTSIQAASPVISELSKRVGRPPKIAELKSADTVTPKGTLRGSRRSVSATDVTPNVVTPVKRVRSMAAASRVDSPIVKESDVVTNSTRRSSTKSESQATGLKRSTRSSSHDVVGDAFDDTSLLPKASGSTRNKTSRKSIFIDPFSPVILPELEDELEKDEDANKQTKKRKYIVRKSAKSHRIF